MKILFISGWFPYPTNNGSRIRIYNFIKSLSKKHDVSLISLLQNDSDPADAINLKDICQVVSLHRAKQFNPNTLRSYMGFLSSRPRSIIATYDTEMKLAVETAIKEISPDVIVVSTIRVVEYVFDYLDIPSVLIDHNCEFAVLRRNTEFMQGTLKSWRYDLGWKKLARWESKICQNFDKVVMPTEDDKQQMLDFAPHLNNIKVIPNAADTYHFDHTLWNPDKRKMVYNGAMTYSANLDAIAYYAAEIHPLLNRELPHVKLLVTGRTDGIDLQEINYCPGIEFTGYVEDIRDVLYRSSVCVIPLRKGGGMRLKIPEAMAAGVPVVSTSMGAEGLDCTHNEHLLIADTAQDFTDAVVRVLTDDNLAERLRQSARALIERRYSWKINGEMFVNLVEQVAHK